MNDEPEGIELGTVDSNVDGIELPNVEKTEVLEQETTEISETSSTDKEKESLKKGVNYERNLRKAAEKENKELKARLEALENASKTPTKTTFDELLENGVDENIAKSIASAIDKKSDNSNLSKELADVKFENAITKQSKVEGFEDIEEYAEEIKELVNKGLTIEQSYYAVSYNKPKTKDTSSEIQRKLEAKMQNNQARKEILGNYNSNTGTASNTSNGIKLTPEERGIAAMAGMTAEEYAAYRNMDSVKDYNKYTATRKS